MIVLQIFGISLNDDVMRIEKREWLVWLHLENGFDVIVCISMQLYEIL